MAKPSQLESKVGFLELFVIYYSSRASEHGYKSDSSKSALIVPVGSLESLHEEPCSDCLDWKYIFS